MGTEEQRAQPRVQIDHPTAQSVCSGGKAQAVEARVLVLLGLASGLAGSEVGLPETCSVQGVPGGRMKWVNVARGLPTPECSSASPSFSKVTDSLLESTTEDRNCAHFTNVEMEAQQGEVPRLGDAPARM